MTGGSFQEIFVLQWMFSAKFVSSILDISPYILHCVKRTFHQNLGYLAGNVADHFDRVPYFLVPLFRVGVIFDDPLM